MELPINVVCAYPKDDDNEEHLEKYTEDDVACKRQGHNAQKRSRSSTHNRRTDFTQSIAYARVPQRVGVLFV